MGVFFASLGSSPQSGNLMSMTSTASVTDHPSPFVSITDSHSLVERHVALLRVGASDVRGAGWRTGAWALLGSRDLGPCREDRRESLRSALLSFSSLILLRGPNRRVRGRGGWIDQVAVVILREVSGYAGEGEGDEDEEEEECWDECLRGDFFVSGGACVLGGMNPRTSQPSLPFSPNSSTPFLVFSSLSLHRQPYSLQYPPANKQTNNKHTNHLCPSLSIPPQLSKWPPLSRVTREPPPQPDTRNPPQPQQESPARQSHTLNPRRPNPQLPMPSVTPFPCLQEQNCSRNPCCPTVSQPPPGGRGAVGELTVRLKIKIRMVR